MGDCREKMMVEERRFSLHAFTLSPPSVIFASFVFCLFVEIMANVGKYPIGVRAHSPGQDTMIAR